MLLSLFGLWFVLGAELGLVLLGRRRLILALGIGGLNGHLIVIKAVFLAAAKRLGDGSFGQSSSG